MGVETAMLGMAAASTAASIASASGSAGAATLDAKTQEKIARYNASVQKQDLHAEKKDFKREASGFMARMRNFVGTSGAAGTASEVALRDSAAGEIGRALGRFDVKEERIEANQDIELASLEASRNAIKQKASNMKVDALLGFAGNAIGTIGGTYASDTSAVTSLSTGGKSLVKGRTSSPGGIGGF